MLSRLISLLRRIPAVGWAINRLRPAHDLGEIAVAPAAVDQAHGHGVETVSTPDIEIAKGPLRDVTVHATASADAIDEPDTTSPVVAEQSPAASVEIAADDVCGPALDVEAAPVALAQTSIAPDAIESVTAEMSLGSSGDRPVEVEQVLEEPAHPVEANLATVEVVATAPVEDSAPVPSDDVSAVSAEFAPAHLDEPDLAMVLPEAVATEPHESGIAAGDVAVPAQEVEVAPVALAQASIASDTIESLPADTSLIGSDDRSVEVEEIPEELAQPTEVAVAPVEIVATAEVEDCAPVPADERRPVSAEVALTCPDEPALAMVQPEAVATAAEEELRSDGEVDHQIVREVAAELAVAAPMPESRSQRTPRRKTEQPADRTALIRQRWAETGVRMWNPRLHGAGNATLNIQGRIELLPPADGETMPRYDKLEFKLLGGQIVCEGVIVEAPAPASHRSFSQFAEPRHAERAREPARARQAALA